MKIKILGTRGEIKEHAPHHVYQSGILLDDKLLLDCGQEQFLAYKPEYILITHLHPDHAYFVRHSQEPPTIPIYAPEQYKNSTFFITDAPFSLENYRITPIPTIHSVKVQSNAYLIEHNGKRLLYTGDLVGIDPKYHALLKNMDLVITEGSYVRKNGVVRKTHDGHPYGHTGIPNLIALFKKYTNTIVLVHFGSWFFNDIQKSEQKIAALAQENALTIILGYDGLEIII